MSMDDKLWVQGMVGGSYGKVPSSCIVKVDSDTVLPQAAAHETLFVVSADFTPTQDGDLGLLMGNVLFNNKFVVN